MSEGLSRLSEKCRKCPFVDTGDHKEMEALAFMPLPSIANPAAASTMASAASPVLRETMNFVVNGQVTQVYKDDVEKQLQASLYAHLGLPPL